MATTTRSTAEHEQNDLQASGIPVIAIPWVTSVYYFPFLVMSDSDGYESDSFLEGDNESLDLKGMTVPQLKNKMKTLGEKNYSRLNKAQLVDRLKGLLGGSSSAGGSPERSEGSEDDRESLASAETVTGKRKLPSWISKSSKRQKTKHTPTVPSKSEKKTKAPKKSPKKPSTDSLALAFSSEEDLSSSEEEISLTITKKESVAVIPAAKVNKSPAASPILTNTWISKKKKPSDTPGLFDLNPSISTRSETDLLDTLCDKSFKLPPEVGTIQPTKLPPEPVEDDEDDSIAIELSGISTDADEHLPRLPLSCLFLRKR